MRGREWLGIGALAILTGVASGCGQDDTLTKGAGVAPVAVISGATAYVPLDTATFDGSGSYDTQGTIVSYAWSITARPSGSTAQPVAAGANGQSCTFFVDFAGDYKIRLTVTNQVGLSGSTEYSFSAVPTQDLHVELAWDTNFSDLDLHLVDQTDGGQFYVAPLDCYYSNKTPEWGDPSSSADNPTLDIDDVDGYGPENINIIHPDASHTYHIYVQYYDTHGAGATNAEVKIYVSGVLKLDKTMPIPTSLYEWDVATIDWPSGTITEVGTVQPHANY